MKQLKNKIYIIVTIILILAIFFSLYNQIKLVDEIEYLQFRKQIYNEITEEEFDLLLGPELKEQGIYIAHRIPLINNQVGIKAYLQNNLLTRGDFTVQVFPKQTSDNFEIDLPASGGPFSLNSEDRMTITFTIEAKQEITEDTLFVYQVIADDQEYAQSEFKLFVPTN